MHNVLRKHLKFHPYKLQILQEITQEDKVARKEFAMTMLDRVDQDNDFLARIMFSDETTFHVSGKVNKQNVHIWGSQNPHSTAEHIRDSPKVNVWCGLLHDRLIGPFFFRESTVTSNTYFVYLQLEELHPRIIFQQDGAPPHWALSVCKSQTGGLAMEVQFIGRLDLPTSHPVISFFGDSSNILRTIRG